MKEKCTVISTIAFTSRREKEKGKREFVREKNEDEKRDLDIC